MPKAKGTLLAVRNREIPNSRRGTSFRATEVAFIPVADPDGFPAVMKVDAGIMGDLDKLAVGQEIEITFTETPPYGDKFGTAVAAL